MTASHCTDMYFDTDGSHIYQPAYVANAHIGREIIDPPPNTVCGEFSSCRRSDAAMIAADDTLTHQFGAIARTQCVGYEQPGCLDVPFGPGGRFWITAKAVDSTQPAGETVDKVGQRTGWTWGTIEHSCVDWYVVGKKLLCQWIAHLYAGQGDSGAPIGFATPWLGEWELFGVLWGGILGADEEEGQTAIYSTIQGIEYDFGQYLEVVNPDSPPRDTIIQENVQRPTLDESRIRGRR